MPSKSKKQKNFFKNVKAFKERGIDAIIHLPISFQEKIKKTAERISDKDLDDMLKMEDEIITFEIGDWVLIDPKIKNIQNNKILPFITKIKSKNEKDKIINFSTEEIYHTNGAKRLPSKYYTKVGNIKFLNFAPFSWIKNSSKKKDDLIFIFEIRKIIRKIIN